MADKETTDILREVGQEPIDPFRGQPWYNAPGDCLVWYFSQDEGYAVRVDDKLTVYRSFKDDSLVGCQIKGVQALLRKLGSFDVKYQDRGVSLELVFCVSHFVAAESPPDDSVSISRHSVYHHLRQRAEGIRVVVPQDDNGQLCEA